MTDRSSIMIQTVIETKPDYIISSIRIVAGIIMFPYGMQKLLGWFGGAGIQGTLDQLKERRIPTFVSWLIVVGQSFGSLALIGGFMGRIAAAGLFIIMTGAMITHAPQGWSMNWFGKKEGEGIEYFIMLLTMLLVVVIRGSGAISADRILSELLSGTINH